MIVRKEYAFQFFHYYSVKRQITLIFWEVKALKKMKSGLLLGLFLCMVFVLAYGIEGYSQGQSGRTYTIVEGDTLSEIAQRLTGSFKNWPALWRLNQDVIENPHLIFPGEVIRLDVGALETPVREVIKEVFVEVPGASNNIALDLLLKALVSDLRQNDLAVAGAANYFLPDISSAASTQLPVCSVVTSPTADNQGEAQYYVSDTSAYYIGDTYVKKVNNLPATTPMSDKVRDAAEVVESNGKYLYYENYKESLGELVHHQKMIIFAHEGYFFYYLFTNVNENFSDIALLDEPVDVLRIRIFSDKGSVFFSDRGLQGVPSNAVAQDARGGNVSMGSGGQAISGLYEKALDILIERYAEPREEPSRDVKSVEDIVSL